MIHWFWLIPAILISGSLGVLIMCLMTIAKESENVIVPDITMCNPNRCPSKEKCYRYMAEPTQINQAWNNFDLSIYDDGTCEFFYPLNKDV